MIGGWQLSVQHQVRDMSGSQSGGFLIENKYIFAMIAGIISEHKIFNVRKEDLSFGQVLFLLFLIHDAAPRFLSLTLVSLAYTVKNLYGTLKGE